MRYFQVAELYFSIDNELDIVCQRANYLPFEIESTQIESYYSAINKDFLFHLEVNLDLPEKSFDCAFTYSNEVGCYGVSYQKNIYEWILKPIHSNVVYRMQLDIVSKRAQLNFVINDVYTLQAADDFIRFAFIYTSAFHQTVLLHASCIKFQENNNTDAFGILFMGNSGIGKSTHSQLWLKYIPNTELLNDDQPAIRYLKGNFVIYGTPWSGKTNCYKNKKALLKAILCMKQAHNNQLISINKLILFTNLLNGCSLIKDEKNSLKQISATLASISDHIPGAYLENKADKEAADIAFNFFHNSLNSKLQ